MTIAFGVVAILALIFAWSEYDLRRDSEKWVRYWCDDSTKWMNRYYDEQARVRRILVAKRNAKPKRKSPRQR